MEQEPIYVSADRLRSLAESVVGRIYSHRQDQKEDYVRARVAEYNDRIKAENARRKWFKDLLGIKPKMYITPAGMEDMIFNEVNNLPEDERPNHPICQIYAAYGQLEHEAKDAMISCQYNDSVMVSADFTRGVSHLGIDLSVLKRPGFGFMGK